MEIKTREHKLLKASCPCRRRRRLSNDQRTVSLPCVATFLPPIMGSCHRPVRLGESWAGAAGPIRRLNISSESSAAPTPAASTEQAPCSHQLPPLRARDSSRVARTRIDHSLLARRRPANTSHGDCIASSSRYIPHPETNPSAGSVRWLIPSTYATPSLIVSGDERQPAARTRSPNRRIA